MLVRLNHKVHVLFRRQDLDMVKLEGKIVIVLDVLFATSTMIAALADGAAAVIPTLNEEHAREHAKRLRDGSYVLAGELFADQIPGFAPPTPMALMAHDLRDRTVVYATTNGTVALHESAAAEHVYAGALINAGALVSHIARAHAQGTILIVCSGSMGNPNLEDLYGAGCFVDLILKAMGERDLSDAAWAARALYLSEPAQSVLLRCRVGKLMQERGLTEEVKFAARESVVDVVPKLIDGRLTSVAVG
ncbi:MAG TPA: 2-phosphosulfolactate phosphatase [Burkholderiales bacterium]|nr:2-phosphosulfolactate phosphatase [Burkholderiales bacterium]